MFGEAKRNVLCQRGLICVFSLTRFFYCLLLSLFLLLSVVLLFLPAWLSSYLDDKYHLPFNIYREKCFSQPNKDWGCRVYEGARRQSKVRLTKKLYTWRFLYTQFLATESLLKWWKMLLISPWRLFWFSRYLNFCLEFPVM